MVNFGNISIVDLRLGATQVGAAYLGNKQVWSLGPVVPKYDIKSIGRSVLKQGTSIEISEQAGETITLYIKTNATDLTNKQVCAAVYLNSTDVTPYASFAFSNVSLVGRYITGTTPDVSTWVPSGFPETYSILYMKTWIQDTGYIDPADALGEVLDWTGEELAPIWLSFTAEQANSTVRLDKVGSPDAVSLETSTDGTTWTDYSWTGNTGDTLTLVNVGDKVYMRAKNENDHFATDQNNCYQFVMTGTIAASGNLQTLLKADGSRIDIGTTGQGFRKLFIDCTSLTSAPELPATTLIPHGYEDLFKGCTNLSIGPTELPAQTAVQECYRGIFSGCSSLVAAPKIAAINFGAYACGWMFEHCSSLNSIEVVFSTWPGQSATLYWVSDVAASGTFTCPAQLPDLRGANRIPSGWTKVNAA